MLNTKLNTKQLKLTIIVLDPQLILRIPRIGRIVRFLYVFCGSGYDCGYQVKYTNSFYPSCILSFSFRIRIETYPFLILDKILRKKNSSFYGIEDIFFLFFFWCKFDPTWETLSF